MTADCFRPICAVRRPILLQQAKASTHERQGDHPLIVPALNQLERESHGQSLAIVRQERQS